MIYWQTAVIDETVNTAVYQKILKENVQPSVCDLKHTGVRSGLIKVQTWIHLKDDVASTFLFCTNVPLCGQCKKNPKL